MADEFLVRRIEVMSIMARFQQVLITLNLLDTDSMSAAPESFLNWLIDNSYIINN